MEKMKAALMYGPNDVRVELVDKPICDDDGLLIKIQAVGLCGSDIRNFLSDSHPGRYPVILGHEQAGQIDEIGSFIQSKFKVGERVYISPVSRKDKSGNWDSASGGFAEYLKLTCEDIKNCNILPLPNDLGFPEATLTEPLSAVYACHRVINIKEGQVIIILGAGTIGCMHAELAKESGAGKIIMIDLDENRLKNSLDFGVDFVINSKMSDPVQEVIKITEGILGNHVICANSFTEAQQQAIYLCQPGGIVTLFGGVPKGEKVEIDTNRIHYSRLWLYGHAGYNGDENSKAFELICSNKIEANKYITRQMPLDEINEAIKLVLAKEALKIVLLP
jgi:L-iditol 2-dehydrogenase